MKTNKNFLRCQLLKSCLIGVCCSVGSGGIVLTREAVGLTFALLSAVASSVPLSVSLRPASLWFAEISSCRSRNTSKTSGRFLRFHLAAFSITLKNCLTLPAAISHLRGSDKKLKFQKKSCLRLVSFFVVLITSISKR